MKPTLTTHLNDVRSALHRQHLLAHDQKAGRPGWRTRPTLVEGLPAVLLTWHTSKAPDSGECVHVSSEEPEQLRALQRHLQEGFIVGQLYDEQLELEASRALVALLVFPGRSHGER
ncbi:hypothetical protein AB0I84_08855 [Streptomyces spectabilis]|uniref:hypothetical protein n=1 Tax=Streptomyces spectabilis TaxID=68270 RepID=UPI0034054870